MELISFLSGKIRLSYIPAWDEAPLDVWQEVIQKYPDMSFWVAQNKSVPVEILSILASDPEFFVRQRIAYNKKATFKALQILSHDNNDELSTHALKRISEDRYR